MTGTPAPPPPSKSNSSACTFKSNTLGSSSSHESAQCSSTSPVLPLVRVLSDASAAVLGIVGGLRARGFLAKFEIPESRLMDEGVPALFDEVLAAFLAEVGDPAAVSCLPIPPPPIGDDRKVELLGLFLTVRAHGGFCGVVSWPAVAEAVGLDPTADTAVKLLYDKYLMLLEQSLDKKLEDQMVMSSGNADWLNEHRTTTRIGSAQLKRKRDALVGMLDWVHRVAQNPCKPGIVGRNPPGHKQKLLELRSQMFADKDCLARVDLVEMFNWVRLAAMNPGQPEIFGMNPPDHLSTAVELRRQTSLVGMLNWVRNVATSPAEPGVMGTNSLSHRSTTVLFRRQNFANKNVSSGSAGAASRKRGIRIGPCYQANIPEWTRKPSSPYDDPNTLTFLGEPILLPKHNEDLAGGSIGKGRQDDCNCQVPGSIACVRFHVAEKKTELKRELGSAYYEMRFHRIGNDLALSWTKDEERKFNNTVQDNLPSCKYKLWDKLLSVLHSKGKEGLVSYYHNVFQVWRRAYQNRLSKNADSDDDSIEPAFLYFRQGGGQSHRSRSAASSSKGSRS